MHRQEKKGVPCATVVLQPWMLRSKERDAVARYSQGLHVRGWYPRGAKAFAYKVQDAMIDFAYCPQLNAFRRARWQCCLLLISSCKVLMPGSSAAPDVSSGWSR